MQKLLKFLWLWSGIGGQFWYDCGSYNWVQDFDTFDMSVGSLNRQLVCFRQIGIFYFCSLVRLCSLDLVKWWSFMEYIGQWVLIHNFHSTIRKKLY